ncbi:MAG: LPS assembly lipoprotein LptE [Desulfuromusa sp.]|nr:LPS assembly lipoprotein LptE [Desulfuromusa sp.]
MKFLSMCILLFCLSGCGYHFPGHGGVLPGGVGKLYIPLFVNKTAEPQLEFMMTSRVSEVFSRNSKITQVEMPQYADAILKGTVRDYKSSALSYDSNDAIGQYRSTLIVDAVLQQAESEQLLWEGTVSWSEIYSAADDKNIQEGSRLLALNKTTLRLAEELLYQLLDDF